MASAAAPSPLDLHAENAPATLRYYAAQQDKLQLNQLPPANAARKVTLTGRTAYRYVMIQVQSPRGEGAVHLYPDRNGAFDVDLLFSRGTGDYRLTFFGSDQGTGRLTGVAYTTITATASYAGTDPALDLGPRIAEYLRSRKGVSIGRGECWDAAQSALDENGAFWNRTFEYGRPVALPDEGAQPGDIIQFRNLRLESRDTDDSGRTRIVTYQIGNPDHTSIILEVRGPGRYLVAHQNVNGERQIIVEELDLNLTRIGGGYSVFRPQAGLIYRHRSVN